MPFDVHHFCIAFQITGVWGPLQEGHFVTRQFLAGTHPHFVGVNRTLFDRVVRQEAVFFMSTARTFPPQEGGNLILSKRRVVFGFASDVSLLLTDFVCRRVLRIGSGASAPGRSLRLPHRGPA